MNSLQSIDDHLLAVNLEVCKRFRPALYDKLMTVELTDRYWLFESDHESRVNNLIDRTNEKLFYSQDDPIGSMAAHMETCINTLQGISVCFGFGLGYSALMLVQQTNFVSRSIIVLEPDPEVFLLAFRSIDCSEVLMSEDVVLLIDTPIEDISTLVTHHIMEKNRLINAKNLQLIDTPAAYEVSANYFNEALKKIKSAILESVKIIGNCPNDALQGLDTSLANLPLHAGLPGIESLRGLFNGHPGVVVASGPSLDKNIDLLEGLSEKCIIASADASLRHLISRKLKPHFVTSIERIEATSKLFAGLSEEDFNEVILVGSPVCHPKTFEAFKGQIVSADREHGFFELLALNKGTLIPGPSAGNMAFRLLNFLGCDPIILIGQDLALSPDGKTHASGNPYGDQQENYMFDPIEVEGNYEPVLRSNPILKMFHNAYEVDVSVCKARVINATEGGAKINNTVVSTFQAAIDQHITKPILNPTSDLSISQIIAKALIFPEENHAKTILESAKKNLAHSLSYLSGIDELLDRASEASDKYLRLFGSEGTKNDSDLSMKLELEESMNKISALSSKPEFVRIAMDVVSAVFFHTMVDYVHAMANAHDENTKTKELARNVQNLANNFRVLLRFVKELCAEHLRLLEAQPAQSPGAPRTLFQRRDYLENVNLE